MARRFPHWPGRSSRLAAHLAIAARLVVGAFAVLAFLAPVIMDERSAPPMRLADDGGGSTISDPPYDPTPSGGGSPSPSDDPSGTKDGEDGSSDTGDSAAGGLPVAAQAGISLGVIALAALTLLPGRRPPAHLR